MFSPATFDPDGIPNEMKAVPHWVNWKLVPATKKGKPVFQKDGSRKMDKVPFNAHTTAAKASSTSPHTWATFDKALHSLQTSKNKYVGMGFVFCDETDYADPYVFCDLDHHISEDGTLSALAQEALNRADSWAEISQSGEGLHIIIRGHLPGPGNRNAITGGEMYSTGRYAALTGNHYPGTPLAVVENQPFLDWFHETFICPDEADPDEADPDTGVDTPDQPTPPRKNPPDPLWLQGIVPASDDMALLEKARNQKDGKGERFRLLYDVGADPTSEKALALCNDLAFWCGPDETRILSLFQKSALYRNYPDTEKWDRTLVNYTIPEACAAVRQRGWADGSSHAVAGAPVADPALDRQLAYVDQTDAGNAVRLIARHGANLRYCGTEAAWYVYNGKAWEKQRDASVVIRKALSSIYAIRREAATIPEAIVEEGGKTQDSNAAWRDSLKSHAKKSQSRHALADMVAVAAVHEQVAVLPAHFDQHENLLACENGILDLEYGDLIPHDREKLLTQWMPVKYDKDARAPRWETFLTRILPDCEVREYVQAFLGYSLSGLTNEQIFLFLYGSGANGKSVLMGVLAEIWGELHARIRSEVIMYTPSGTGEARFGLGAFIGRRLVTFGELDARSTFNEPRLKELTGKDTLQIEQKNRDPFNYKHHAKIILAGNYKPRIIGVGDDNVWRRVKMIPFEVTIPVAERDSGLQEKLLTEKSGILNWLLDGLKMYQRNGLVTPLAVEEATKDYQQDSDALSQFVTSCCEVGPEETATGGRLYAAYLWWAKDTNQAERTILSAVKFPQYLVERGFRKTRTMTGVQWTGLSVKLFVEAKVETDSSPPYVDYRKRYDG